jgi:hypothetical protein
MGRAFPPAKSVSGSDSGRSRRTLDVYTHVMPLDEVSVDMYRELVAEMPGGRG